MPKLTGQILVKVDGDTIVAKSGQVTFEFGGKERTPQYADNGTAGFTEKPIASTCSGTLQHGNDTDMLALSEHQNVTLVINCDSGKSYMIREAFATKPPSLSGEDGDLEFEYMGQPAVEL